MLRIKDIDKAKLHNSDQYVEILDPTESTFCSVTYCRFNLLDGSFSYIQITFNRIGKSFCQTKVDAGLSATQPQPSCQCTQQDDTLLPTLSALVLKMPLCVLLKIHSSEKLFYYLE